MTDHDFHKSSIDDAIDNAVRDLVQLDPRPGLRRRVLSQLDAPSVSRSWLPRVVVPLGALASIVIVLMVLNRQPHSTPLAPPAPAASASAVSPAPATSALQPSVSASAPVAAAEAAKPASRSRPSHDSVPARSEAIFGRRGDRVSAASVKPGIEALPPLVLPPLIIEPLNLDALPGRRIR